MSGPLPKAAAPVARWTFRISIISVPWALATAFVLLIGWVRNINLLLLLGYLLAALPLLNAAAAARPLRGLRARRHIAESIYAGVSCTTSIQIVPGKGVPLGLRLEDFGPDHQLDWFVDRLERDGRWLRGQVVLPRRGRYAWGPVLASSGYPFGLVFRRRELLPAEEVIVLPRLGRLRHGLFRRLLWSITADPDRRRQARRHPAAQDQFHGLRPFRTGDNPRSVHWRTSARRGEWMIREFEDLPGDNLLLVFDPAVQTDDAPPQSKSGETPPLHDVFEAAVSLAATIAVEWRGDRGRLIAAVAGEDATVLDGPTGAAQTRRVLERLAVVEPQTFREANHAALLEKLKAVPSAAVVVVGVGHSRFAEALRRALQRPVVLLNAAALSDLDFYTGP